MEANKPEATVSGAVRLLSLVLCYIWAPGVSFVVSYAVVLVGTLPLMILGLGQVGFTLLHSIVGFCGVYSGAQFLPQATRRVGSVGLLLLGLIYFCNFVANWKDQVTDEGKVINMSDLWCARLVFLAIGGLLAVLVICGPPRKMPWRLSERFPVK